MVKLRNEIEYLLHDLCVKQGFCIPPEEAKRISELPYLEANDFARQVLVAEGMNPDYEKQWMRTISEEFIGKLGREYNKN